MLPCSQLPAKTDIVVVGNGPAGILISLLLNGYEPYYHAEPSQPHPDPILHRMLSPSSLQGCRPRSLLKQDFVQLTNHIQHQLAEAGRDANPISAMFDSLAHPYLDTHRGEYPSFLEWRHRNQRAPALLSTIEKDQSIVDSPPLTPTSRRPANTVLSVGVDSDTTARPHVVLGRGDVGGIWADMEHDHNQTLSYHEHMELPIYSFTDFVHEHPEHGQNLDRPLRSTVSAYYKTYVQRIGLESNFSNYTTVTGIYHLKDLDNHCCCPLDPQTRHRSKSWDKMRQKTSQRTDVQLPCQECAPYRYALLGYVESVGGQHAKPDRTRFLIRSKTVVLATGTFDKPKKLPAVSAHPCELPTDPATTIQQTFHDTRQLEDWLMRHGRPSLALEATSTYAASSSIVSPPPSPLTVSSSSISGTTITVVTPSAVQAPSVLPIVIVGTGLSAADAILLIQEKQPWRRIIHIYRHYSASEPSPLKRCHRDVYPEYASVWVQMKKFATLKNSVQSYPPRKEGGHGSVFASSDKPSAPCADCKSIVPDEPQCLGCSYKGLPDASVSSWDPVSGDIAIILSHGVIVKEHVAAVGVFIGKQVHMGFLKGSLAQEMLSTDGHRPDLGISASLDMSMRRRMGGRRGSQTSREGDSMMVEIPTPPCTPPRSPVLRPRSQFWQTQKKALECLRGVCRKRISGQDGVNDIGGEEKNEEVTDKETYTGEEIDGDDDDEAVEQFQVLTLLRPLVSDMYSFRIIPTGVISDPIVDGPTLVAPSAIHPSSSLISASPMTSSAYPTRAKRCTRLPCYPLRATAKTVPGGTCGPGNACDSDEALDKGINGDEEMNGNKSSQGVTAGRTVSCISMPCSPLLRSCSTYYPSLPTPPILTLCSAAVSALSKSIVASPTRASSPVLSSSSSSPALSLLPSPTLSSGAMFASSSASSLVSEKATSTVTTDREQEEEVEEEEREGCCPPPPSSPFEEDIAPLMDQSIYAAGAITGSKFVRYVLGNGVAVVADILKNET